jgi:ribose transport system permease protein
LMNGSDEPTGVPMEEVVAGGKPKATVERKGVLRRFSIGRVAGALIGLVGVAIFLSLSDPVFLTWGNILNIFRAQSVVFILAIGATFVILTGGLDLSVASATGFSAMIMGFSIRAGVSWVPAILISCATGICLGFFNGFLIGKAKISFFVTTLGTLSIYASVILAATRGTTISLFQYPSFSPIGTLANSDVGPIPIILLIIVALYLLAWVVLHRTSFGRSVYATGSNPEAARLNGLNVNWILVAVYTIAGLMAGLGAVQQTGRLSAAVPIVDPNQMLAVIAAVLIGGMSLRGGEGGLLGTFLGVLFMGVIQNGLTLKGVSAFWQGTVTGSILIAAVGLAVLRDSELRSKIGRAFRRRQ